MRVLSYVYTVLLVLFMCSSLKLSVCCRGRQRWAICCPAQPVARRPRLDTTATVQQRMGACVRACGRLRTTTKASGLLVHQKAPIHTHAHMHVTTHAEAALLLSREQISRFRIMYRCPCSSQQSTICRRLAARTAHAHIWHHGHKHTSIYDKHTMLQGWGQPQKGDAPASLA